MHGGVAMGSGAMVGVVAFVLLALVWQGVCTNEPMLSDTPADDNSAECVAEADDMGVRAQEWLDFVEDCESG